MASNARTKAAQSEISRMQGFAQIRPQELFFDVVRLARYQFRREIVPQFVTDDTIHAAICNSVEPIHSPSTRLDPVAVGRELRMSQSGVEHRLLPIDQHISNARIDHAICINDLEMAQETGGEIAVAWAELQNRKG